MNVGHGVCIEHVHAIVVISEIQRLPFWIITYRTTVQRSKRVGNPDHVRVAGSRRQCRGVEDLPPTHRKSDSGVGSPGFHRNDEDAKRNAVLFEVVELAQMR
jgi:hypothetical protein